MAAFWLKLLILIVLVISPVFMAEPEIPHEKLLIQRIRNQYQKLGRSGRPLLFHNDTFRLEFTLSLVKIIDLDEEAQALTSVIWSRHKWKDPFLTWNPKDFGGIKTVRVPVNAIWKPDFILYNNLNDQTTERDADEAVAMAWVHSDGTVIWIPPNVYKSQCDDHFDSSNFPYDEPQCSFKFGSWAWETKMFDPSFADDKADVSLVPYVPSQRWELAGHWANKNMAYYSCCPDTPFSDLTYTLKLRRGNLPVYQRMLLWPIILLFALTVVPFLLPAGSKSKVLFAGTVFIAFFLYGFLLHDMIGSAAKNASRGGPKIVICFCIGLILSAAATFFSALIRDIYDCSFPTPHCIKKIFVNILAPIVLCTGLKKLFHRSGAANVTTAASETAPAGVEAAATSNPETPFIAKKKTDDDEAQKKAAVDEGSRRCSNNCCCILSKLNDWQIAALVLNRICLLLFAVTTVVILSLFMPRPLMSV